MSQSNARSGTVISGSTATSTTSGRVVLASGASTTVTHSADASNLRRAKFYEYVVTGTADNPVMFQANFDGANAATSHTDQSAYLRTITFAGSAQLSTAQTKYGATSLSCASAGSSYITVPSAVMAFGTSEFTIEMWVRLTSLPGAGAGLFDCRPVATNGFYPYCAIGSSGQLLYYINSATRITSSVNLSTATWYHLAFVRSSGTTTLYIDGVSRGTWADSSTYLASTVFFGSNPNGGDFVNGYYDDIRITHSAVYTGAFTPPASAHALPTYTVTYKPRAESVVTILHDDGTGANRTTKTTATNASGGTLQGELIVIQ